MGASTRQTAPGYYNMSFLCLSQAAPLVRLWVCTQLQFKSRNNHPRCNSLMHSREGSSWKLLKLHSCAKKKGVSTEKIVCCMCMSFVSSRKTFQAQMLAGRGAVGRQGAVLAVPFRLRHCTHLLPMAAHKRGRRESRTSPAYIESQ